MSMRTMTAISIRRSTWSSTRQPPPRVWAPPTSCSDRMINEPRGTHLPRGFLFNPAASKMETPMSDTRTVVLPVESCNLGKLGDAGVALRVNFVIREADGKSAPRHAVFGLSRELAEGLIKGLTAVLEETTASPKH